MAFSTSAIGVAVVRPDAKVMVRRARRLKCAMMKRWEIVGGCDVCNYSVFRWIGLGKRSSKSLSCCDGDFLAAWRPSYTWAPRSDGYMYSQRGTTITCSSV